MTWTWNNDWLSFVSTRALVCIIGQFIVHFEGHDAHPIKVKVAIWSKIYISVFIFCVFCEFLYFVYFHYFEGHNGHPIKSQGCNLEQLEFFFVFLVSVFLCILRDMMGIHQKSRLQFGETRTFLYLYFVHCVYFEYFEGHGEHHIKSQGCNLEQ